MLSLFKSTTSFTILFTVLLFTDIGVKLNLESMPWRFISKPLVVLSLIAFYLINKREINKRRTVFMLSALICFLIGDIVLIDTYGGIGLVAGMIAFMSGKIFYAFRFSHNRDFSLSRLFVFLLICFGVFFMLFNMIYNNLENLFIPVLCYFFIAILAAQFAFIRKVDVDTKSYLMVLSGIICAIVSDSITALAIFYQPGFAYEEFSVMFFYGLSQYLVVVGIVQEVRKKVENPFMDDLIFEPAEDQASL